MWGIGRELYEWKNIRIPHDKEKDKWENYRIYKIEYKNGLPETLIIVNSKNKPVYKFEGGYYKKVGENDTAETNEKSPTTNQNGNANSDNQKKENVATSEKTTVKTQNTPKNDITSPELDEKELESLLDKEAKEERILESIKKKNHDLGFEIKKEIYRMAEKNEWSNDDIKAAVAAGRNFFTEYLKIPYEKVEMTTQPQKPSLPGFVVVELNAETFGKMEAYFKMNIEMPF